MSDTAGKPIRIALADNSPDESKRLATLLTGPDTLVVGVAHKRADLFPLLAQHPDVLLLAADFDPPSTITPLVKELGEVAPATQVLLLSAGAHATLEMNFADVQRALLAGARGIVARTGSAADLVSQVREVFDSAAARQARLAAAATARPLMAEGEEKQGQVVVLFSPKGGVGCSVLSCGLALTLRQQTGQRVALVDYSLQFGVIGTMLDLRSNHQLTELMGVNTEIDSTSLNTVLVNHPSGLRVLLPPARLEDLEEITPGVLVDVLDGLRAEFDWVIVDTWHTVEPATLAIMEAADLVLLITTPELPALDSLRRFIDSLPEYPSIPPKLRLLVNRHPSLGGVELDYVSRRLDLVPFVTFPSAGIVMTHLVNEGAGAGGKANPFTRQLQELVHLLTGAPQPEPAARQGRRGLFARRT